MAARQINDPTYDNHRSDFLQHTTEFCQIIDFKIRFFHFPGNIPESAKTLFDPDSSHTQCLSRDDVVIDPVSDHDGAVGLAATSF